MRHAVRIALPGVRSGSGRHIAGGSAEAVALSVPVCTRLWRGTDDDCYERIPWRAYRSTRRNNRPRPRETEFDLVLALDLPSRVSWLGFTIEGSLQPLDRKSPPELEFEANVIWLPEDRTSGWLSSNVDVVDNFSSRRAANGERRVHA